jgi:hypothetical protein
MHTWPWRLPMSSWVSRPANVMAGLLVPGLRCAVHCLTAACQCSNLDPGIQVALSGTAAGHWRRCHVHGSTVEQYEDKWCDVVLFTSQTCNASMQPLNLCYL